MSFSISTAAVILWWKELDIQRKIAERPHVKAPFKLMPQQLLPRLSWKAEKVPYGDPKEDAR